MGKIRDWLGRKFGAKSYSVQLLVGDDGFMVAQNFTGGSLYTVYTQAIWTYICVSRIAQDIATFPALVQVRDNERAPWITDPSHDLNALLQRPYGTAAWAPRRDWQSVLGTGVLRGELGGNQFYRIESRPGKLLALQLYLAELKANELSGTPYFTSYRIQSAAVDVPVEQVVNIMHGNPDSHWQGVSPTVANEQATRVDYAASRRMRYDMETRVQPGIVFKIKALFTMSDNQRQKALTMLNDTYEGAVNAGKSLVVGDDTTIDKPPIADAGDIPAQALVARNSIISSYDVSPPMVGVLTDAKYTNWAEAKRAQFNLCILPRLTNIYNSINNQAIHPIYGDNVRLHYDLAASPLGLAALSERGEAAKGYYDMGVPMIQLNSIFSLGVSPYEGWDQSNMQAVVAGREAPENEPEGNEPDPDPDPEEDDDE
jgi:phage portal protein BeeE